ncbi:hypothetical protein Tco_1477067 [Tanacetum coccineum]
MVNTEVNKIAKITSQVYFAQGLLLDKQKTQIKFKNITTATACRPFAIRLRDHDDYQDDDAYPKGENNVKRQKTLECGTYLVGGSSSGQAMEQDPNLSGSSLGT